MMPDGVQGLPTSIDGRIRQRDLGTFSSLATGQCRVRNNANAMVGAVCCCLYRREHQNANICGSPRADVLCCHQH